MKHTPEELLLAYHVRDLAVNRDQGSFFEETGTQIYEATASVVAEWRAAHPVKSVIEEVYAELGRIADIGRAAADAGSQEPIK